MIRRLLALSTLAVLALLLTGCIEMKYHLTLNANGTANVAMTMAVDESAMQAGMGEMGGMGGGKGAPKMDLKSMLDGAKEEAKKDGYTLKDYKNGSKVGFTAVKNMTAAETQEFFTKQMKAEQGEQALVMKKGLFFNTYKLNLKADPSGGQGGEMASSYMDVKFLLTTPGKATKHNAQKVSDDGRTLEWDMMKAASTGMQAELQVPNMMNMGIAGLVGLLLIGGVVGMVARKAKG